MSRYIDADYVLVEAKNIFSDMDDYGWLKRIFENPNAPSIDLVRCKECKWLRHCETEEMVMYLDCDHPDGGGIPRSEEWFCADGEREGE